jgi:hypothetical protein
MNWQSLGFTMAWYESWRPGGRAARCSRSGREPGQIVREEGRSGTASRRTRWCAALVTSRVAFALILLVGAGLLLASFSASSRSTQASTPHADR